MIYIESDNLVIRDHIENDLHQYHKLHTDDEVMKFLDFRSNSLNDSRKSLKSCIEESKKNSDREKYYFAIIEKNTNKYIGEIGFSVIKKNQDGGVCNFGYFIHKKYWNKGIVTEATTELIRYIFTSTNLHKIETGCIKENKASERVMIKCGFHKESELRMHTLIGDEWKDRLEYGLLKSDWINLIENP